jgi:membrane protease YdiL (CAAX protease family)
MKNRLKTALFSVVALASGWVGILVDRAIGSAPGEGPGMLIWIVLPFAASLLLRAVFRDDRGNSGFAFHWRGHAADYAFSAAFYPVAAAVLAVLGVALGAVEPRPGGLDSFWRFSGPILVLFQIWTNILEESGFRGYLTPKAASAFPGRVVPHLLTGIVWGAWHIPYLSVIASSPGGVDGFLLVRFLASAVVISVVYGLIRLRTGSLWPAVIMQITGGLSFGFLNAAFMGRPGSLLSVPAFEGVPMIGLSLLAVGYQLRKERSGD